jgi:hypothetical protein
MTGTRTRWGFLLAGCLAVANATGVEASAGRIVEASQLAAQCRNGLHRYLFDCTCTAEFLANTMEPEQGEILMRLWVLGVNDNNQNQDLLNLYLRFGRKSVDDAVMTFHRNRDRFRSFCVQGGPLIAD